MPWIHHRDTEVTEPSLSFSLCSLCVLCVSVVNPSPVNPSPRSQPLKYHASMQLSTLLSTTAMPLVFAAVLLIILVISFRSRAVVFCQYLERMTGIELEPA